ncbi:cbb3-type cytochrome oxidase subunit 3 [Neisseriaceae bacterium CLB008]|nr:CcoQ/FixQ family Cbb3-type cytochrome c oxidase assembly chaperone [Neisseriaceae bacterium]
MADVNTGRILYTLMCLGIFLIVLFVVYGRKSKKRYDQVSQALIDDDDLPHEDGLKNTSTTTDRNDGVK